MKIKANAGIGGAIIVHWENSFLTSKALSSSIKYLPHPKRENQKPGIIALSRLRLSWAT